MEITVSILLFLILMSVIVLFGYRRYSKPASFVEQQIGVPVISSVNTSLLGDKNKSSGVAHVMQPIGSIIPASSQDLEAAKRDLVMAGYRSDNGPAVCT